MNDLDRPCWQMDWDNDMLLMRYRVEIYQTTLHWWRSEPLMLTLTAFGYPEDGLDCVSHHNLEVILHRMFPDLHQFDVKWIKPVVNFPAS